MRESIKRRGEVLSKKKYSTRVLIMRTARKLFAEKGYSETKIQDLLAFAGVSPGAFYNYFSNKEELFLELLREAGDLIREKIRELRSRGFKGGTIAELEASLEETLTYFFDFMDRNQYYFRLIFRGQENSNPRIQETLYELLDEFHIELKEHLERGIHLGIFESLNSRVTAYAIMGTVFGVANAYLDDRRMKKQEAVNTLTRFLLRGLYRRSF